jgi:hypothetical protein
MDTNSKFDLLMNNYKEILNMVSLTLLEKQRNLTSMYNKNLELKKMLEELKNVNNEVIKLNSNVFVAPLLNNIKFFIEDFLNKDLLYQTKIENERISILNKKFENNQLAKKSDADLTKNMDTKDVYNKSIQILNLIK